MRHSVKPVGVLVYCLMLSMTTWCLPSQATPQAAARFYEDALRKFEKRDLEGAVIQLKNAIQEDQKLLSAHVLLGKAMLRQGELKGAEAAFEEALRQGVNRGEVAIPMGRVYLALGQPQFVIERIKAGGLATPLQVSVLTLRGNAFAELGDMRQATLSFAEARSLDPRSAVPLVAEIPLLLGAGERERPKFLAARAVEFAPSDGASWFAYGSVFHATQDLDSALKAYDRAIILDPYNVDARVARAGLLMDLKRDDDARKDVESLELGVPDEPRAGYLRALLAGRRGDTLAVRKALNDVVGLIDSMPPEWLVRREQMLMVGVLAHHGLANWQKAREYAEILTPRFPRNLGARKLLASIYMQAKEYPKAQPLLEALRRTLPDDPQVMYLLGSIYLAQGKYLQATELLEAAYARMSTTDVMRALGFSQIGLGQDAVGVANLEKAFASNPGDVALGTSLAMHYVGQGQHRKALETVEGMVKRDAANLTALNLLGSVKAAINDRAGARQAFSDVLAKNPAFRPAALNLAKLDGLEGRHNEGRRRFNEVLAKDPDNVAVLTELAYLERRSGRLVEAVRFLKKASDVARANPVPGLALIDLYLDLRQPDEAVAVAKDMSSKYPDSFGVRTALARASIATGDRATARSVLQAATRLAEYDPKVQVQIGRLQLAAENPAGARYNAEKALQGLPGDVAAMALLVDAELGTGDQARADAALRQMNLKHPQRIETLLATARLAVSRGQTAAAITAYRAALLREERTEIALSIASAHLSIDEGPKAVAFLEAWTKKHKADREALKALAEAQYRSGMLQAARLSYIRVIDAEPDNPALLNNFANLLVKLNDKGARVIAEKALRLAPQNPLVNDTMGWILVHLEGQVEAGLRYLRDARLRDPDNPEIRFHLAYALSKAGRKAEAREELGYILSKPNKFASAEGVVKLKVELGL